LNVECCNAGALQSTQLVGESSPSLSASTTGLQPTRLLASSTGPSWAKSAVHEDAMLLTVTISATAITVAVVCLVAWLMRRRNCRGPTSDQPSSARRHAPGDRRFSHSGARTGGAWEGYMPPLPLKLAPPNTTDVAPPHMISYHREFLPVGVSVTHVPVLLSREHQGF